MKAINLVNFGISNLVLTELHKPAPGPLEVLIKIEAVALNSADLGIVSGFYNPNLVFPHVPVADGAGIVEAVGGEVTKWKIGDKVAVHFIQKWLSGKKHPSVFTSRLAVELPGVLAEYVTIPEYGLVKAPSNLTLEEAATLPIAGLTAWTGLMEYGKLQAGQTVLTQGSGGVSIFALQLAKAAGAKVIATSSTQAKLQKLKNLGADEVINYKNFPDWHEEARRLTQGEGVDIILDVVGGNSVTKALKALRPEGFVGLVGLLDNPVLEVDLFTAITYNTRLQGISVGSRESFEALVKAIEVTNLKPVIDTTFPIENTQEAFRYLQSGEAVGKIVIKV